MSDILDRAREALSPLPLCADCGGDHSSIMRIELRDILADLVPELVAEIERLRRVINSLGLTAEHSWRVGGVTGLVIDKPSTDDSEIVATRYVTRWERRDA